MLECIKSSELTANLPHLLARVQDGEGFAITSRNHVVAMLVPAEPQATAAKTKGVEQKRSVTEVIESLKKLREGCSLDFPGGVAAAKAYGRR